MGKLRVNGVGKEDSIRAIATVYPIGSGRRPITGKELADAWEAAKDFDDEPWEDYNPNWRPKSRAQPREEKKPNREYVHDGSGEDIPQRELPMSWGDFFKNVLKFRDEELIRFARYVEIEGGEHDGELEFETSHCDWPAGDMAKNEIELREKLGELGSFYAINPLKPGTKSRAEVNVSRYLYTLLEHDSLPKEQQLAIYRASGLPIVALLDSGHKSIHAIVLVNAPHLAEYKRRREVLDGYFKSIGFDSTKDAVRYSRLPNAPRVYRESEDAEYQPSRQRLLEIHTEGLPTWESWEASLAPREDYAEELNTAMRTASQMHTLVIPPKEPIIGDWSKEGDIGYVYAMRGDGKTWFAMETAKCASQGIPFGPYKSHGAFRVLYVDGEVAAADGQSRLKALGATGHNFSYLNHEILFDQHNITIDLADKKWQRSFLESCKDNGFNIIVLDNLSCLAPSIDENDSISWSSQLLNFTLDIRRRNMSLVMIQHAGRNGLMRGHSRREDPANWIIKLKKVEESCGARFRSSFEKNRNAASWPVSQEWHFRPEGSATIVTYRVADGMTIFLDLIESGIETNKEIAEEMGVTVGRVSQLASRAENEGWIKKNGAKYKLICR
jgi:putative DNA primase/helicase